MNQRFHKMRIAEQLAEAVAEDIERGRYGSDGKLPSMRQVARDYSVSLSTVQDAWDILKNRGLIDTTPRGGGRVVASSGDGEARRIVMPIPVAPDPAVVTFVGGETFSHRVFERVRAALKRCGYEPIAQPYVASDPDSVANLIESWRRDRRHLVGMVGGGGFTGSWCDRFVRAAESLALPWVSLNPADEFITSNFVAANHFQIGAIAGRLLAQTGKTRVAFVTVDSLYSSQIVLAQFSGLVHSFDRAGVPWSNLHVVRVDEPKYRDRAKVGHQAAIEHIRAHGLPDAFLSSDQFLLGVLDALSELNIAVPDDVPVLGLTGIASMAERAEPSLTTINTPIDAVADNLTDMLLSMIRDKQRHVPGRYCSPGLTVRRSFAVPEDLEASIRAELGASVAADTAHRRKRRG